MSEQSNLKRHQHCPMRTHVGNCLIIGGFCTSIREDICDALHKAFQMGARSRAKEGEWINKQEKYQMAECSNCKKITMHEMWGDKLVYYDYCPNCGAKMKG